MIQARREALRKARRASSTRTIRATSAAMKCQAQEDGVEENGRYAPRKQSAGKQPQPHEHDAGSEPRKTAGTVSAEQNNEQNQDCRKRQRPKDLNC